MGGNSSGEAGGGGGNHLHDVDDDNDGGDGDIGLVHCLFDSIILTWISFSHYYFTNTAQMLGISAIYVFYVAFFYRFNSSSSGRVKKKTCTHT